MHNKMEIEGADPDAVQPSAVDFRCEAGQMRRFHGQICRSGGENAAETAETQCYVNYKEVKDAGMEKRKPFLSGCAPGHGVD